MDSSNRAIPTQWMKKNVGDFNHSNEQFLFYTPIYHAPTAEIQTVIYRVIVATNINNFKPNLHKFHDTLERNVCSAFASNFQFEIWSADKRQETFVGQKSWRTQIAGIFPAFIGVNMKPLQIFQHLQTPIQWDMQPGG